MHTIMFPNLDLDQSSPHVLQLQDLPRDIGIGRSANFGLGRYILGKKGLRSFGYRQISSICHVHWGKYVQGWTYCSKENPKK